MAGALVKFTNFTSAASSESKVCTKRSGDAKRTVKMMFSLQAPLMRVRNFSGLRGDNALDNLVNRGQDSHSRVTVATSVRKGKPSRIVPKAMFERFTEKAIKVMVLAQEKARRFGHSYVGTE